MHVPLMRRFRRQFLTLGVGAVAVAVAFAQTGKPAKPVAAGQPAGRTVPSAVSQPRSPGVEFRDCDFCPLMVVVPPGSFRMGSPERETERGAEEGPQHNVTIGYGLAVGKFEVTLAEWKTCVDQGACTAPQKPSYYAASDPRQPVYDLDWNAARKYVQWLAARSGKPYRLLTEAEWEYVARAGSDTARPWGDSADQACLYANVANASSIRETWWKKEWAAPHACEDGHASGTAPVGSYRPNRFGVHDMLGNVWEWVEDCYADSYAGAPVNGSAVQRSACERRVVRGGSWVRFPRHVRSAHRNRGDPAVKGDDLGFRVALTLP